MKENERPRILVVDDEQSSLNAINRTLRQSFDILMSLNGQSALEVLKKETVDVILADQRMPEMTGVALFQRAQALQPDATRVLITGYTDIEAIVQAINDGKVFYYLNKPWEPEDLRLIIQRAAEQCRLMRENKRLMRELKSANERLSVENTTLQHEVRKQFTFEHIIGNSPAIQKVFALLGKVIPTDTSVLILGETGTGKELIARAIHYNGPRRDQMFVAQNCGALPDNLLESELFGHFKGAFTGATADKKGLFEIADGGTIFMDEIGDTSPAMQQRLLRVLQEGEFSPVGSGKTVRVDVRIISAANRDLQAAVAAGTFRQDLFYRLNVFPVRVPPLRERREDIPLLAQFFLEKYAHKIGKNNLGFTSEAIARLMTGDYPGNVRELENMVQRAVTLADDDAVIGPGLLNSQVVLHAPQPQPDVSLDGSQTLKEIVEQMERFYIRQALEELEGNITRVARQLGLSRLGLHKKLQRYEIEAAVYKQSKQ